MRNAQKKLAEESDFLRERNAVLDVLRYGEQLIAASGAQPTAQGLIWVLAQDTLEKIDKRTPDKEMRWLRASERAHMMQMVMTRADYIGIENARLQHRHLPTDLQQGHTEMSQYDASIFPKVDPTDIEWERAHIVLRLCRMAIWAVRRLTRKRPS